MSVVDEERSTGVPASGTRRRLPRGIVPVLVAVAVLAAATAGAVRWHAAAGRPTLVAGSSAGPDSGVTWANDGLENTKLVLDPVPGSDHTIVVSVRNAGSAAVTIRSLEWAVPPRGWDWSAGPPEFARPSAVLTPAQGGSPTDAFLPLPVTVPRGREVALRLDVHVPACGYVIAEGGWSSFDGVTLDVTQRGVSSVQHVPVFAKPLVVLGRAVPAGC
jgi:hypothetical protein